MVTPQQFDVFPNPSDRSRDYAPYVVVLQSHLLEPLHTIVVEPLIKAERLEAFTSVSVPVNFRSESLIASLPELVAIDRRRLGKRLGDIRNQEDAIRRGIERLFSGF